MKSIIFFTKITYEKHSCSIINTLLHILEENAKSCQSTQLWGFKANQVLEIRTVPDSFKTAHISYPRSMSKRVHILYDRLLHATMTLKKYVEIGYTCEWFSIFQSQLYIRIPRFESLVSPSQWWYLWGIKFNHKAQYEMDFTVLDRVHILFFHPSSSSKEPNQ